MASEARTWSRPDQPVEVWPPDDSEESVMGTDFHQMTIINLRWGMNEVARLTQVPGQPLPWQALSQTILLGCRRRDGSRFKTLPDVFVYRQPIDQLRGSVTIEADGPPLLIVEVLSELTYDVDLDLKEGKGYSYARAGVREYLTLDTTGLFLPEGIRAWRLVEGAYRPWAPEADGRWHSAEIAVAIALEGRLATVYTRERQRMLHEGEVAAELARRDQELARRDQELARRDQEIEEMRRRLGEL